MADMQDSASPTAGSNQVATRVLNLYAGIGGNRKLWDNVEVTAVENVPEIAEVYQKLFPDDTVIVADTHQYLLDHHKEFDFIWSSPPCPTHSRLNTAISGWGINRYPDLSLYQEIIFLKHFFKGQWLVENVISYYAPLIMPTMELERHYLWSNFYIPRTLIGGGKQMTRVNNVESLSRKIDIALPAGTINQRKLLRNAVDPKLGLYILDAARRATTHEQGNDLVALDLETV